MPNSFAFELGRKVAMENPLKPISTPFQQQNSKIGTKQLPPMNNQLPVAAAPTTLMRGQPPITPPVRSM